jgi:hypothetical protein
MAENKTGAELAARWKNYQEAALRRTGARPLTPEALSAEWKRR